MPTSTTSLLLLVTLIEETPNDVDELVPRFFRLIVSVLLELSIISSLKVISKSVFVATPC